MNAGMPRQGILSLTIKDKRELFRCYMSSVNNGGLFVPTGKHYSLGDEVFLLLTLMDESDRIPVAGKVIWITPPGCSGSRETGIGIQFNDSGDSEALCSKIETHLAAMGNVDYPTHTM